MPGYLKLFILLITITVSASLLMLQCCRSNYILRIYKHENRNDSIRLFDIHFNHTMINIRTINGRHKQNNYSQSLSQRILTENDNNGIISSKYSKKRNDVIISNTSNSRFANLDTNCVHNGFLNKINEANTSYMKINFNHANQQVFFGVSLDNNYNDQFSKTTYKGNVKKYDSTLSSNHSLVPDKKIYKILYWTKSVQAPERAWTWFGYGRDPFKKCEYSNCLTTRDKNEYKSSDAVLMYMHQPGGLYKQLPSYQIPKQKWIIRIQESPANRPVKKIYNNLFHAVWTYKEKSDIYIQNYHFKFYRRIEEKVTSLTTNYAKGKSKMVAWLVSHCTTSSEREVYANMLKQLVQLDIYGACGDLTCPKRLNKDSDKCMTMLEDNYKFYLSFENSICREYVTEKLWRTLDYNMVPIVLGGANYSRFMPPCSYINVADFKSVQELAKYLHTLDKNDTLYNEYFHWKSQYQLVDLNSINIPPEETEACIVCKYINKQYYKKTIYKRQDLFWNKRRDCKTANHYYTSLHSVRAKR